MIFDSLKVNKHGRKSMHMHVYTKSSAYTHTPLPFSIKRPWDYSWSSATYILPHLLSFSFKNFIENMDGEKSYKILKNHLLSLPKVHYFQYCYLHFLELFLFKGSYTYGK